MTVESRQLQVVATASGTSDPRPFDVPGQREFRIVCDRCAIASPWQTGPPGKFPPPAWFLTRSIDEGGLEQVVHLCGHCAGGGGKVPIPKADSIWWSHTRARSVARVVASDGLGGVSVQTLYTPRDGASRVSAHPRDKRIAPAGSGVLVPARDFYAAWGRPKPDPEDLSPRAIWLDFTNWETVTIDGAEHLGGDNYMVCCQGQRYPFPDFVRTHVPTGARQPRSRYQRLLEDDDL